jgi:hypothetical protein
MPNVVIGYPNICCINYLTIPQYIGLIDLRLFSIIHSASMDIKRLPTRWLFILDYLDEDTGAVAAAVGSADDRDECESVVRHEAAYYQRQGFTILRSEACELCRTCDGSGFVPRGGLRECPDCGGFAGPMRKLRFKI